MALEVSVKMADKRKGKKKKEEFTKEEPDKASKEEYAVASWLRKNVPTKKTKFLSHNVEYFTASRAVDALLASTWATGEQPTFTQRQDIVIFLDTMLRHKFFHRAKKVPVSEAELKAKLKKKEGKKRADKEEAKKEEAKKEGEGKKEDAESSHAEGKEVAAEEKVGKKRKIRLDMHLEQTFVDGLDAYVWIYDPIPYYYWLFGALLVLGAIAICLFPLWPPSVRKGVYYLSVAAAGFLIFIIGLAVLRLLVFCLVWAITLGRHHLWLFPNLTEDVGFLASFWPLYHYEYKGDEGKKKKRKKKDKDSDNEEENKDDEEDEDEDKDKAEEEDEQKNEENKTEDESPGEPGEAGAGGDSESESESSQKSLTGKDFEMVEKDDLPTS